MFLQQLELLDLTNIGMIVNVFRVFAVLLVAIKFATGQDWHEIARFDEEKRQTCDTSACEGQTATECVSTICTNCGPVFPDIAECCKAQDSISKIECLQGYLQGSGGEVNSNSSTALAATSTLYGSGSSTVSSPSTTTVDPCSQVESSLSYCELATPGFTDITAFSSQASCLCYRYQTYNATGFDAPYAACQKQLSENATMTETSAVMVRMNASTSGISPCATAGPVRSASPLPFSGLSLLPSQTQPVSVSGAGRTARGEYVWLLMVSRSVSQVG